MLDDDRTDVAVLGAGIVGVSAAYAARERGLSVTLIDRREPGCETSYGNAGVLSSGSIVPNNTPALFAKLPHYITNRHAALRWNTIWATRNANWLARYLSNATRARVFPRAAALRGLSGASLRLHRDWMAEAGVGHRLRETGWLKAWRSNGREAAQAEHEMLAEHGVHSVVLNRDALVELEPNIVPAYNVGLLLTESASVDSPGNTVKAYSRLFTFKGGQILQAEIKAIQPATDGWRVLLANRGTLRARHVVVALGPWSAEPLRALGYRIPLAFERGYHQEFEANPTRLPGRPIYDVDGSFILTPMENGIRVTSGVELTARDAPSNFAQIEAAVPLARGVTEFGEAVGPVWRGARPTLPDSLPMIGPAPRHQGLWLAFGHQHIGFATGPATGSAIADMISGTSPSFDVGMFSPARYLK